jgi:hypothetical protein
MIIDPERKDFGCEDVNNATGMVQIDIINNGINVLQITDVSLENGLASQFTQDSNCIGFLTAGASCFIDLDFSPTSEGPMNDNLLITYDDSPVLPEPAAAAIVVRTVPLRGTSVIAASDPDGDCIPDADEGDNGNDSLKATTSSNVVIDVSSNAGASLSDVQSYNASEDILGSTNKPSNAVYGVNSRTRS